MSLRAFFLRHRTKQSNLNEITSKEYLSKIPRKDNATSTRSQTQFGNAIAHETLFHKCVHKFIKIVNSIITKEDFRNEQRNWKMECLFFLSILIESKRGVRGELT
jgi:hypothetical protein